MTHFKIIVNPLAGNGNGERMIPAIEHRMKELGLEFDLVRTERPWHAVELAAQAATEKYDVVVAAGGDGTANEVLNGLMTAKETGTGQAAMGILCVGRGNDFAFGMGIPNDWDAGCQVLAAGQRRWVDVGKVTGGMYPQGRYFGNGVGVGFDAVVGFVAARSKLTGFLTYIVAALKTTFLYYKAPLLKIEYGDQEVTQLSLMVATMNGRRFGGGFMMAPDGKPDDGLFDVIIVRQVSKLAVLTIMPLFMKGTHLSHPAVRGVRARRVAVTALQGSIPAHCDGETLCTEGQQLVLELIPRQIEMVYQPENKAA